MGQLPQSAQAVEIVRVGRGQQRPPRVDLLVDVVLRNAGARPAWYLLPTGVDAPSEDIGAGGVHTVEVLRLGAGDAPVVGRFIGPEGFTAMLLAPMATAALRQWPLSLWDDGAASVSVTVVIASEVTIGERPIAGWLPGTAQLPDDAELVRNQAQLESVWHSDDLMALPVTISEIDRVTCDVPAAL